MAASEWVLYVAPGTADGQSRYETLTEAVEAARSRREGAVTCRIVVAGGTHFITTPVCLDARDSGLSIEGAPGETAILCGGRPIAGWRVAEDGLWVAEVPKVREGGWNFRVLIMNGRWCDRARWPEEGWHQHRNEAAAAPAWQRESGTSYDYADFTTLVYDPADLGANFDPRNAEIRVYHSWDESLVRVLAVDPAAHTLTLHPPCIYPPGTFAHREYVIFNTRDGLTRPGQWLLDRTAGQVVYWPLPGERPEEAEAVAPYAESILQLHGSDEAPVRDVVIRNLTFTATRSYLTNENLRDLVAPSNAELAESMGIGGRNSAGAISLQHAQHCTLAGLALRQIGGQAIKARDVRGLRVLGCQVADIGAAGIALRHGQTIELMDNRLERVGRLFPSTNGIIVSDADHVSIHHNEIHETPYVGISLNTCRHGSICSNRISRVMQEIDDGAGIYLSFGEHIIMRANHVSDLTDSVRYERNIRHAYYFDVGCKHGLLQGNLAERCSSFSHTHMAEHITICDNVFIADGHGAISFRRSSDCHFVRNIVQVEHDLTLHDVEAQIVDRNVLFTRQGRLIALSTRQPGGECELRLELTNRHDDPRVVEEREGRYVSASSELIATLGLTPVNVADAGCGRSCHQFYTFKEDVNAAWQRLYPMLIEGMSRAGGEKGQS
jgi:hypothetical protein